MLLTVLLVLAIGASSALVFTNRVELLKLAVVLALWAAVVAAFVSVIYRRQSDIDQAKVRDLKLVYDLQLDREISARREYELTVETQLRRELTSEIRAQAADEVAGLRAELAALRANLEILFDADLSHRRAIETDPSRAYGDWPGGAGATGRVTASRIDTEDSDDFDATTEESPIIDVSAEPHPPEPEWEAAQSYGGAHRRPSQAEQEGRRHSAEEQPPAWSPLPPQPVSQPMPEPEAMWQPPQQEHPPAPPEPETVAQESEWQPAPADGQWIPAGAPGSNWQSPDVTDESTTESEPEPEPAEPVGENGAEYVGRGTSEPAMPAPSIEGPRGRHSAPADAVDPGRPHAEPTLAAGPAGPPPHSEESEEPAEPPSLAAGRRHRSAKDTGGQSVAELLARLHASPTGGSRRRRRDE